MFHIKIGNNCTRRIREKAFKKNNGDHVKQYKLVETYCKELVKSHPGSSSYVDFDPRAYLLEDLIFKRLYVCLKPLVDGFYVGCRKLIGLDGCQTKGFYKSRILSQQ
ncbi:hypothetical protein LIER_27008 [Lithospermum erythrorhizon]|uniref:Uncharacterized protein n=1 Tax=Lithospermum erythrorhizon TaxID=34254 RepID=A0AAV3RCH3_LITER